MKSLTPFIFLFCVSSSVAFGSASTSRDLSFELVDNRILIDTYLNGTGPFKMILDSNSSSLTVNLETAHKLNLPLANPTPCNAVGATPKTCYGTQLNSAVIASFSTKVSDAAVVPDADLQRAIGFKHLDSGCRRYGTFTCAKAK